MARVQVAAQPWGYVTDRYGNPRGDSVCVFSGTVYLAATGVTTVAPTAFKSDALGLLPGWVDEGSYTLTDADGDVLTVEAVSGSGQGFTVAAATGVLATDTANILAQITAAAAAKGVCVIPKGKYVCGVDVASLSHVKIRGEGTLHCPTAGDDALNLTDCPDAEVSGIWVQGETATRNGIRLVRCHRAKVKVRCQGSGAEGIYAEKCIGIDVDSYVGIDVASPFPTSVANSTGGVKLTWDGVAADSGCNQFRLAGWYVIGKTQGWAVEIVRAEGGVIDSTVPELSKGGIKLDTCQNLTALGYYGEANPSDVEYTTGTASVTNGSTAVTGAGTAWNTNDAQANKNAMVGKFLIIGTSWAQIGSITNDTAVTLASNWPGATQAGVAYRMQGVDLYMKSCTNCTVISGRGGGAVLLEGSSRNVLYLLTESIFFDATSDRNEGRVITNRASTSATRLVDNGAENRIRQLNWQTGALVKDDTIRTSSVLGVQTMTGLLEADVFQARSGTLVLRSDTANEQILFQKEDGTEKGRFSDVDDFWISRAGGGLRIKEGANAKMGTAVLNGTTEVTITTNKVTATSRVLLTINTPGGTVGSAYVSSRSVGVSFGVKSTTVGDTSTVAWIIVEPA